MPADLDAYQTVFAEHRGSVAAPTAGLHFTTPLLDTIRAQGTTIANVTPPMVPFFFAMLAALMLITYWPPLTMWLPQLFGL